MFHNHLLKTLAVFVILAVLVAGIGYLLSSTATSAEAAAPTCGTFTINTAGLSSSELYYAQQAERFMVHGPCSAQPVPGLSTSGLSCAQPAFSVERASHNLSPSEVYYAQRAQRFMPCEATNGTAGLPQ